MFGTVFAIVFMSNQLKFKAMLKYESVEKLIGTIKHAVQNEVSEWLKANNKDTVYLKYKNGDTSYHEAYMDDNVLFFAGTETYDGLIVDFEKPIGEVPVEDAAEILKVLEREN